MTRSESGMLSRHATMGLLLLRATCALAWTPGALRLDRSVAARSGRRVACQRCSSRTFPARLSITRNGGGGGGSSTRHGAPNFATSMTPTTPTEAVVGGEDAERQGSSTEGQDAAAGEAVVTGGARTIVGVEVQPLLQPHMELLGSASRRK